MKRISKLKQFLCKKIDDFFGWFEPTFVRLIRYKRWEVHIDGQAKSRWEEFYDRKEALLYANRYKGSNYWVSLRDNNQNHNGNIKGSILINKPEEPVKMGPTLEEMKEKI